MKLLLCVLLIYISKNNIKYSSMEKSGKKGMNLFSYILSSTIYTTYISLGESPLHSSEHVGQWHHHHHHHHIALAARISLTLSRHSSLSFIALGRSSGQQPVSSHSCWMYVRAGRPAFVRPCVGIHKSTSLMSSSLLLQQCPSQFKLYKHQPLKGIWGKAKENRQKYLVITVYYKKLI